MQSDTNIPVAERRASSVTLPEMYYADVSHCVWESDQGGKIELGAPTGKWQMIVVYRGKHCPVSKNYLASLQQIIYELDELGVEVIAVSGDGRERAEAFVSPACP